MNFLINVFITIIAFTSIYFIIFCSSLHNQEIENNRPQEIKIVKEKPIRKIPVAPIFIDEHTKKIEIVTKKRIFSRSYTSDDSYQILDISHKKNNNKVSILLDEDDSYQIIDFTSVTEEEPLKIDSFEKNNSNIIVENPLMLSESNESIIQKDNPLLILYSSQEENVIKIEKNDEIIDYDNDPYEIVYFTSENIEEDTSYQIEEEDTELLF